MQPAGNARFLPPVEMTDGANQTFYETIKFGDAARIIPLPLIPSRQGRGNGSFWKVINFDFGFLFRNPWPRPGLPVKQPIPCTSRQGRPQSEIQYAHILGSARKGSICSRGMGEAGIEIPSSLSLPHRP